MVPSPPPWADSSKSISSYLALESGFLEHSLSCQGVFCGLVFWPESLLSCLPFLCPKIKWKFLVVAPGFYPSPPENATFFSSRFIDSWNRTFGNQLDRFTVESVTPQEHPRCFVGKSLFCSSEPGILVPLSWFTVCLHLCPTPCADNIITLLPLLEILGILCFSPL